jgi:glycosyltransferase involved in cell wall biosynthesis
MKILQIASDYYNTTVYSNLFNQLEKKVVLKVLVPLVANDKSSYGSKICSQNLTCVFTGKPRMFGVQVNSSKLAKYIIENRICDEIDLIHAHYVLNDGSVALRLHKQLGIPYTVSVRASCLIGFDRKIALHNYLNGLSVLKHAEAILFQSPNALDNLLRKIPASHRKSLLRKSFVMPNGIDNFWHNNSLLKAKTLHKNEFTIITVASIEHNKNLQIVAKAIQNLNNRGYSIRYKFAGSVVDETILSELTQYPNTNYLGVLNRESLLNLYRSADIFVMVSHCETFGLVYAEAMSQGLPVVYTKGEGFDGQFEEGIVGYHATSKSLSEIEDAILKIVANYDTLAANATINAGKFDWGNIASKYCDIYAAVMEAKV